MKNKKGEHASKVALTEAAQLLVRRLYGAGEQLMRITVWTKSGIRIRVDTPEGRQGSLTRRRGSAAPPTPPVPFVPTPFQKGILQALAGQALRTDDLGRKVGNRRKLFNHPGGLRELQEHGQVAHHKRLGYYRPDVPPPSLGGVHPDGPA